MNSKTDHKEGMQANAVFYVLTLCNILGGYQSFGGPKCSYVSMKYCYPPTGLRVSSVENHNTVRTMNLIKKGREYQHLLYLLYH
jgi:hypothetical protein